MITKLNVTNKELARKILDVQIPSYKIESEIIGFYGIPQLSDTVDAIIKSTETFIGYWVEEELVAFISYIEEQDIIDICRLVVHPHHFRKGIAKVLVEHVVNRVIDKEVIVSTGAKNIPAKNLYKLFGFEEVKDMEVAPGVFVTKLARQ